jgi:hypothetical protein
MWRKEKINIYMYMCVHTQEIKREKEREERKSKKEKTKREKNLRQCKKDIRRDDKSSKDQEKCKEGCNNVDNESSMSHTICNLTSRTSLVP